MRKRGFLVNGQHLTELYQRRGWSQQDFADRAGLDVRTIAKVKRGGSCDASTLQRIAQTLAVEPESLIQSATSSDVTESNSDLTPSIMSEDLKIVQAWKIIDLRHPKKFGDVPSGIIWERYRITKRSDACPSIAFPYLTWGDEIACLEKPANSNWRRVPVQPGDIVHSDKHWEISSQSPFGPAGTQFEFGPIQLHFVNAFHGPSQQWWQLRIAYEVESLIVQVLFAEDLPCKQIEGTWAMPGQRNFTQLPSNDPHLLTDGSVASWHLSRPSIGSYFKLAWTW
jgi:transcriptional regulator with XRE-family HTH domain